MIFAWFDRMRRLTLRQVDLTTTLKESRFNSRLATAASIATVLALAVAVGAWLWPRSPSGSGPSATPGSRSTGTTAAAVPPQPGSSPGSLPVEYLAGPGFPAEAGGALLVSVPRAVREDPAYSSHPVAITCPDNSTGDQVSEVTYVLHSRYLRFDATVHPYYPPTADTRSVTWVSAMVDVGQRDGTYRRTEAGRQRAATMTAPAALSADVENAEKLTLSVRCADPNGTIVLTDARLTGAG